ncbi:MAG: 30S ribosomal protein S6 [Patescibacteria group bacterium]|jgi:small subunit ribosomal protein S6
MSKTKKSTIGHYEILFIMPNKFTEDEAKTIIGNVEKVIADNGGQISYREYWGKKKLAYEIKHNAYGYYSLCEFDLEKNSLAAIDQNLRLSTDVLRHQIVIKKAKSEAELAKDKKINAKIEAKKAVEEKEAKDKSKKQAEASESPKKPAVKRERPTDMKDLDEKLEGILSAKDLI